MSALPSQAKPPGDDFVLWPEAPGQGVGRVNESSIRRSLDGLAPAEWVADLEGVAPAPSSEEPREDPQGEERFYPASRNWFRTTAAIPSADASDKWWLESPPVPTGEVAPYAPAPPAPNVRPDDPAESAAHSTLLSPEEIWELAAEELEQANRLGAPAAVVPPGEVAPLPACAQPTIEDSSVLLEIPIPRKSSSLGVAPFEHDAREDDAEPSLPARAAEAVPAIPVVSRPPIFMRSEPADSSLPMQRRTRLSDQAVTPSATEVGTGDMDARFPEAADAEDSGSPAATEPAPAVGEHRRRRHRKHDRQSSDEGRPRRRWGRWIFGFLGLMLVSGGVTAIIGRDHVPEEWLAEPTRWWRKAHQLVFPHQYGYPRRGVQTRAGESSYPVRTPETGTAPTAPSHLPTMLRPADESRPADETGPAAGFQSALESRESVESPDPNPADAASRITDFSTVPSHADSSTVPPSPPASFTLWDGDDPPPGAVAPGQVAAAGDRRHETEPANTEVLEAQAAVRNLVNARTVEEVLPWIFDAQTLESTVRDYHSQYPLQPLSNAVIEHEYSGAIPATGGKAHIFNVLGAYHPRGFPVSAEFTSQGYRIDWQSYIQWRDAWLRRFLDTKPVEARPLFVVLHRTHYFNDDVPKLDDKLAFKITSAVPGDEGAVAFVEKNSAVGRSLAELYEWRTMYFPVVELQWVAAGKEGGYVRLNRIVRPTWRRIGN